MNGRVTSQTILKATIADPVVKVGQKEPKSRGTERLRRGELVPIFGQGRILVSGQ